MTFRHDSRKADPFLFFPPCQTRIEGRVVSGYALMLVQKLEDSVQGRHPEMAVPAKYLETVSDKVTRHKGKGL